MKELQDISDKLNDICLQLQNVEGLTGAQEGVVQAYVEILTTISKGLREFE